MLEFLSPAWVSALDDAARSSAALIAASAGRRLVIEQRVTRSEGPGTVFHVSLDHGQIAVAEGPAAEPTISFEQDLATARAIASGRGSAQRAFMSGSLRVGGDLRVLVDEPDLLAGLDDVFRSVRERTDLSEQEGRGA